jgi:hypothetical protein
MALDVAERHWREESRTAQHLACLVMADDYVAPALNLDGFHCPYCGTYAHQTWSQGRATPIGSNAVYGIEPPLLLSKCGRCGDSAMWIGDQIVSPAVLIAPPAHDDLADPALASYNEARGVYSNSPRAAGALLRLCLQQLVADLGAKSTDLNTAVGELVKFGLPPQIQQAMDSVRLIGNEAVHPGTIDLNDDTNMALSLFDLVNLTVEMMITQPKMVTEMYSRLPASKLAAIEKRDGAAPP